MSGGFWLAGFSPDGSKAAIVRPKPHVGNKVGTFVIEVVDVTIGQIRQSLDAAVMASEDISFSPDSRCVIFARGRPDKDPDYDKAVFLRVDLATGEVLKTYRFREYDGPCSISPDGKFVLSRIGEVWNAETAVATVRLKWPLNYTIETAAFVVDAAQVRTIGQDNAIRTWDMSTGEQVAQTPLSAHGLDRRPFRLTADGKHILARQGQYLSAIDATTAKTVGRWQPPLEGHWTLNQFAADLGAMLVSRIVDGTQEYFVVKIPPFHEFKPLPPGSQPAP
jgi:WD40 repeat protein